MAQLEVLESSSAVTSDDLRKAFGRPSTSFMSTYKAVMSSKVKIPKTVGDLCCILGDANVASRLRFVRDLVHLFSKQMVERRDVVDVRTLSILVNLIPIPATPVLVAEGAEPSMFAFYVESMSNFFMCVSSKQFDKDGPLALESLYADADVRGVGHLVRYYTIRQRLGNEAAFMFGGRMLEQFFYDAVETGEQFMGDVVVNDFVKAYPTVGLTVYHIMRIMQMLPPSMRGRRFLQLIGRPSSLELMATADNIIDFVTRNKGLQDSGIILKELDSLRWRAHSANVLMCRVNSNL